MKKTLITIASLAIFSFSAQAGVESGTGEPESSDQNNANAAEMVSCESMVKHATQNSQLSEAVVEEMINSCEASQASNQ